MKGISAVVILALFVPASAMAYIDPGTGSMLLQVILGGFAAVGVVLKLYWHKIRRALGFGAKQEPEAGTAPEAQAKDEVS